MGEEGSPPVPVLKSRANPFIGKVKKYINSLVCCVVGVGFGIGIIFIVYGNQIHLISKQNYDSYKSDNHITRHIFKKIDLKTLAKYKNWIVTNKASDPDESAISNWIMSSFADLDYFYTSKYNVLLSFEDPLNPSKIDGMDGGGNIIFSSNRLSISSHNVKPHIFYSAKKSVESNSLVYVNYAQKEDFDYLRNAGVSTSDKILIARFGKISIGKKISNSQKFEAKGLILIDDPPTNTNDHRLKMNSKFGPGVLFDDYGRGDPLTPGWSSLDGSVKLKLLNLYSLPHIPVHYINSEIARNIMSKLGGKDTPNDWIGSMAGLRYKVGGEFLLSEELERVKLQVHSTNELHNIKNIVGMIKGSIEPDRYIIFGSNRAASNDSPNESLSGISAIVKLARSFSETMKKYNWRPRRSILFVSWGAKEFGLLGSTEWVEENLSLLKNRLVAYINLDECYSGSLMSIKASPGMSKILLKSARKLKDPFDSTKSYYDSKLKSFNMRQNQVNAVTSYMELDNFFIDESDENTRKRFLREDAEDDGFFESYNDDDPLNYEYRSVGSLGSEGDYYPFSFLSNTPSVDIRFISHQGNGNNHFDTNSRKSSSKNLKNLQLCIRYASDVMRNFADSVILPFELDDYSLILREGIQYIKSNLTYTRLFSSKDISLKYLEQSISEFTTLAGNWTNYIASLVPNQNPIVARMINDQIIQLPRLFSIYDPHRNITTNILYGPDVDPTISVPFPMLRKLIRKFIVYSEEALGGDVNSESNPRMDEHIFNMKRHITELFIAVKSGIKQLRYF